MAEMAELAEVAEMLRNDDMFRMCLIHAHSKPCPLHTIPLNKTALQCDKLTFNTAIKGKLLLHTITHRIVKQLHTYVRTLSYSICWLTN